MAELELNDIQGIVARGYGPLKVAQFTLLRIVNSHNARAWLANMLDQNQITPGSERPDRAAMNIAMTAEGLEAIGMAQAIREGFSEDFLAGMTTPHKRRTLGDHGASAPERWTWGGPKNNAVHLLLLLYASDKKRLSTAYQVQAKGFEGGGVTPVETLDASPLQDGKEHFGFKDGISQPYFYELKPSTDKKNPVALGELLLGYRNAYQRYTQRPLLDAVGGPEELLPFAIESPQKRDLGKNGTYLVFRQLEQDVERFWSFMKENADPENATEDAIRLASKMLGRWPSGAPLVKTPDRDQPEMKKLNDFGYHHPDPHGLRCPFGAHIRRTQPRDSLQPGPGTQKSIDFSNRHRILRRGRPYGRPVDPSMNPADFIAALDSETNAKRGLHFICLNANIGRQFEFVQHTWSNNPDFNGLYNDPDPLIGDRGTQTKKRDTFTLQATPVRQRICGMPDFVKVRGGGYFFLPGIRALRYLAAL